MGIEARWSYAELAARARRVGRALIAAGIEPGDRVRDLGDQHPAVARAAVRRRLRRRGRGADEPALPEPARSSSSSASRGPRPASCCPRTAAPPLGHGARGDRGARSRARCWCRSARRPATAAPAWEEWLAARRRVDEDRARAPPPRGAPDRHLADPVHLRHHRLPQGRRAQPRRDRQQRPPLRPPRDPARSTAATRNPMPYFHCGGCVMSTLGWSPPARRRCRR